MRRRLLKGLLNLQEEVGTEIALTEAYETGFSEGYQAGFKLAEKEFAPKEPKVNRNIVERKEKEEGC